MFKQPCRLSVTLLAASISYSAYECSLSVSPCHHPAHWHKTQHPFTLILFSIFLAVTKASTPPTFVLFLVGFFLNNLDFLTLTIVQSGHQVLSASKTFSPGDSFRCSRLSYTSFRFVPLSFRMLSMYFSQDVRGLPRLGLTTFTFWSRNFFIVVFSSRSMTKS